MLFTHHEDDVETEKECISTEDHEWLVTAKKSLKFFVNKMVKVGDRLLLVKDVDLVINEKSLKILADSADFNIAMATANNAVNRLLADGVVIEGYKIRVSNYKDSVLLNCWLMHEMAKYAIPKMFKGGIILLYLWLCLGINFVDDDFANGNEEEEVEQEEGFDEDEEEEVEQEEVFDEEEKSSN